MATDPRPALFACLLAVSIGGAVAPPAGAQSVPRSDVRVHRVVDAVSGDAIADAEVALSRSGFTIRSDSAGEFVLVLGAEDRDTLVIRKPGYLRSALLIDGGPTSPDALTVQLNPVRPSDQEADPGGVFREIAETLNLTAGSIWHADGAPPAQVSASHTRLTQLGAAPHGSRSRR